MLSKCVNPSCNAHFRYLEEGALYRLESDVFAKPNADKPEYFWLCQSCSTALTLRIDHETKVRVSVAPEHHRDACRTWVSLVAIDRNRGCLLSRLQFSR